jgi:hypothetical protein
MALARAKSASGGTGNLLSLKGVGEAAAVFGGWLIERGGLETVEGEGTLTEADAGVKTN